MTQVKELGVFFTVLVINKAWHLPERVETITYWWPLQARVGNTKMLDTKSSTIYTVNCFAFDLGPCQGVLA